MHLQLEDYGTDLHAFVRLVRRLDPSATATLKTTMEALVGRIRLSADERASLLVRLREMGAGDLTYLERALASRGAS